MSRTRERGAPVPVAAQTSVGRPLLRTLRERGFRYLQLADFLSVLGVLLGASLIRYGGLTPPLTGSLTLRGYLIAFALTGVTFVVVCYFGGAYEVELRLGSRPQLPRVAALSAVAGLIVALVELLMGEFFVPRAILLTLPVLAALALAGNRRVARLLRRNREGLPRTLLVGAPDDVSLAQSHLTGRRAPATVAGASSDPAGLLAAVRTAAASDVLLLSPRVLDSVYPEPLTTLEREGVAVLQRVTARDTLLGLRSVREVAGMPFVALRTHTLPVSRARFKRCIELVELAVAAVPLALVTALVALYVRIVAGEGVLFRQERVGRDGVPFSLYKFRTMYRDAEIRTGAVLAEADDPRIVPGCRLLRAWRLDELPQLWNVVRGQMSIVGPRPERPEMTQQFEQLIPGYARRHEIPPGITGLAQIHGRYHTDPEYKLGHDLQYLINWSPVLDLQILLRTVWVVVRGDG